MNSYSDKELLKLFLKQNHVTPRYSTCYYNYNNPCEEYCYNDTKSSVKIIKKSNEEDPEVLAEKLKNAQTYEAATIIQAPVKGWLVRNRLKRLQEEDEKKAIQKMNEDFKDSDKHNPYWIPRLNLSSGRSSQDDDSSSGSLLAGFRRLFSSRRSQ